MLCIDTHRFVSFIVWFLLTIILLLEVNLPEKRKELVVAPWCVVLVAALFPSVSLLACLACCLTQWAELVEQLWS